MGWGKVDVGSPVRFSNPNLLDNWYFADPIDQRQGYVVPPDTLYYSDTGLSAQEGTVSAYTTVDYVDGVYGSISVDGATYYVDWSAAVRGYIDTGYTLDRWKTDRSTVLLYDDYIRVVAQPGTAASKQWWRQLFESPITKGTYQISALLRKGRADMHLRVGEISAETSATLENSTDWQLASATISENKFHDGVFGFVCVTSDSGIVEGDYFDIKAAKLELGPVQTLAHQDADGNWVLNDPPPNRALELSKCKQYQQPVGDPLVQVLFTEPGGYTVVSASFRFPVSMRATPSLSLLSDSLTIYSGTDQIFTIDRIEGYVCDKDGCYFINLWGRFENTQENRAYKSKNLNYIWADANL